MPEYWDDYGGQSYDFSPADFGGGMDDWLEKERKRKEAEERTRAGIMVSDIGRDPNQAVMRPGEPEPDFWSDFAEGLRESRPYKAAHWALSGEVPGLSKAGELAGRGSAALSEAGIPTSVQKFIPGAGILPATADLATRAEEFAGGFEAPSAKAARERGETLPEDPFHEPIRPEDQDYLGRLSSGLEEAAAPGASSEEEIREMLPKTGAALGKIPAPIDVATLGAGGVLGLGPKAGKIAQAARQGWKWGNVLEVPGGAIDIGEGLASGSGAQVGLGVLRAGLSGVGSWFDFAPGRVDAPIRGDLINVHPPDVPVTALGDMPPPRVHGPEEVVPSLDDMDELTAIHQRAETGDITDADLNRMDDLEITVPDETVQPVNRTDLEADEALLEPDEDGMIEVFNGGDTDNWSVKPQRAAGYGPVRRKMIPIEQFREGQVTAQRMAARGEIQPTKYDVILDNRSMADAQVDESIIPDVEGVEGGLSQAELDEMGVQQFEPGADIVKKPGERGSIEIGRKQADELAPIDKQIAEVDQAIDELEPGLVDQYENLSGKEKMRLRSEMDELQAKKQELEAQRTAEPEGVDQVADDVARVEADADAAALEADAMRTAEREAATVEGGRIEAEKAAAAGEKLSWRDWVAKNHPKGLRGAAKRRAMKEFEEYAGTEKVFQPPGKDVPVASKKRPKGGKLSWRARTFDRVIDNVKKVSPVAGARLGAYQNSWDKYVSGKTTLKKHAMHEIGISPRRGSEQARAIVHHLDGTPIRDLTPQEQQLADRLRGLQDTALSEAQAAGVDVDYRENHFPHWGRSREYDVTDPTRAVDPSESIPTGPEAPHLTPRKLDDPDWIDDDLDVLDLYYDEVGRKISQRTHLGKDNELLRKDIKNLMLNKKTRRWMNRNVGRVLGRAEDEFFGMTAKTNSKIRQTFAFLKLPKAGVRQVSQLGDIAAVTNVEETMKSLAKLTGPEGYGMKFRAEYNAALRPDMVFDQMGVTHRDIMGAQKFMWGVRRMDGLNRVVAYGVGEQIAKAASENAGIIEDLTKMGFRGDPTKGNQLGKFISDLTQFQGGPLHRPGWTNSELGKYVFQFHNFPYNHSRLVHKMLTTDPGTAAKMITKMVIGTGGSAAAVNQLLSWGKGYNTERYGTPDFEELPLEEKLRIMFSIERVNPDSPGWRIAQELMDNALWGEYANIFREGGELASELTGGGGRAESMADKMGAAPSTIGRIGRGATTTASRLGREVVTGEEVNDPFGPISREALRQIPDVPGLGAVAAELSGGRGHSVQEALWPSEWQMDRYKRRFFDPRLGGRQPEREWGVPAWFMEDPRAGGRRDAGGGR